MIYKLADAINQFKAKEIIKSIVEAVSSKYILHRRGMRGRNNLDPKNSVALYMKKQREPLKKFKIDIVKVSMITDRKIKIVYSIRRKSSGLIDITAKTFQGTTEQLIAKSTKFILEIANTPLKNMGAHVPRGRLSFASSVWSV